MSDTGAIEALCDQAIATSPKAGGRVQGRQTASDQLDQRTGDEALARKSQSGRRQRNSREETRAADSTRRALAAVIACGAVAGLWLLLPANCHRRNTASISEGRASTHSMPPAATPNPVVEQPSPKPASRRSDRAGRGDKSALALLPPPTDKKMASHRRAAKWSTRVAVSSRGDGAGQAAALIFGELARTKADTEEVKALGNVLVSTQLEENKRSRAVSELKCVSSCGTFRSLPERRSTRGSEN